MKHRKERKKMDRLLGLLFIPVLALLVIVNLAVKDKESSEAENRTLAQRPDVTWSSVTDGVYMEEFESYVSDQFAGRDGWRRVYTAFRRIGGSREEEDVILGKNSQLMENIVTPDSETVYSLADGISKYAERNEDTEVYLLLVPDTAEILDDKLPAFASVSDQAEYFRETEESLSDQVLWIDGVRAMERHSDEKIYYQTDHHWTTLGAYDMFLETAAAFGIESPQEVSYDIYTVTDTFNGTLSSTSGFAANVRETIEVYIPQEETPYVVTYVEEQAKSASLYDTGALDTGSQYDVFLGGNYPLIEIETASESDRVLLLVKDSFANSMVSFFVPYYSEIVVVDPRYYAGYIDDLADSYGVTDTLFLYSGNTFFSDTNLLGFVSPGNENKE